MDRIYSVANVTTNDELGGLHTFFVTFMYGYTVLLCLFDVIMRKALYEKEWVLLRFLFSYQIDLLALFSHLISQISLLVVC
jgi:hypothetical protein